LGGAIDSEGPGTLTMTNCTLFQNSDLSGGAIFNNGFATLIMDNCTLSGNSATGSSTSNGGGIDKRGVLTISNTTFTSNTALSGGAIYNESIGPLKGTLKISNSTFSSNTAVSGGAMSNDGMLTMSNSTLSSNSASSTGGGIFNVSGTLTVSNSTFVSNSASKGGGIDNAGTLSIDSSTFSSNSAANIGGGGIFNEAAGNLTMVTSTLNHNLAPSGGGIYNSLGTVTMGDTIIAGNFASPGPDVYGTVTSNGYNLIGDPSGGSGFVATDLLDQNPLLGSLQNNGGPTQTMALLPGSPAIDAGSNALLGKITTDQRGLPGIVNGTVDIGAFESSGFTIAVTGGNNNQAVVNTAFAAPLLVTVTSPNGEPVTGGVVTFAAPGSGASATFPSGSTATIDSFGQASLAVAANTTPGSYVVTASVNGAPSSLSFNLTNNPAAASHLSLSASGTVTAGVASTITVTALDPFNNIATGYRGTVHFTSSDTSAVLPKDYTFTAGDSGEHTFTNGVTLRKTGTQTITVSHKANNSITGSVTVNVIKKASPASVTAAAAAGTGTVWASQPALGCDPTKPSEPAAATARPVSAARTTSWGLSASTTPPLPRRSSLHQQQQHRPLIGPSPHWISAG
jgi:predicted outer membrane repeat protein